MDFVPPKVATPQVKAAATKAVALEPSSVTAHYALAMAAWNEWEWETTEREFQRTIELDPNHAEVRAYDSHVLIALKRHDEAVSHVARAMQLDPLSAFNQALYGTVLYVVRRYDEAILQFESALKTAPDSPVAQCGLWRAFYMTGRSDEALVAAEACLGDHSSEVKNALLRGRAEAGYTGAMRRVADVLAAGVAGTYVPAMDVFAAYLNAGQKDMALPWLSKAVDARDPRFVALVKRTNLPD